MINITTIHIENLALHGQHGVMPQERVVGAVFYVSLSAKVQVSEDALIYDQLSGTVSYADIIASIRDEFSCPAALLEHLAFRMGQRLLNDFSTITSLNLRIDKENPPCGVCVDNIGVEMSFERGAL